MTFDTWQRISRRHIWYKQILQEQIKAVDITSMDAWKPSVIDGYLRLAERVERHQQRMERHIITGNTLPAVGCMQ